MSMGLSLGLRLGGSWIGGGGPLVIVGNSDTIVSGPITWTLSEAADYGYSEDGIALVVMKPGLTVVSRTDAETTEGGLAVNGTMKNPQRSLSGAQGWDARVAAYSAGLKASFPISVQVNDIVVGAVHRASVSGSERDGIVDAWSGLIFVPPACPQYTLAPALIGWAGRTAPQGYILNIDDAVASLPALDVASMPRPSVTEVIAQVDRLEIGAGFTLATSTPSYEFFYTHLAGGSLGNYGQSLAEWRGAAMLYCLSDEATTEQKKTLLLALMREGVQTYDPIAGEGTPVGANGGHWDFSFGPIVAALKFANRTSLLGTLIDVAPMNPLGASFLYDATRVSQTLTPHSDITLPYISRNRTISAVSGLSITVPTATPGDPAQISFVGGLLKRASDGATAAITAQDKTSISSPTDSVILTIDAQPGSPFAASDVVHVTPQDPLNVGDADWGSPTDASSTNPLASSPYRNLNFWSEEVLWCHAIGAYHPTFRAMELYTTRANRTNDPAPDRDYPDHFDTVDGEEFAAAFWAAHAASIFTAAPVFLNRPTISGTPSEGETITVVPATVSGAATITNSYQLYKDGTPISFTIGLDYEIETADVGSVFTVGQTATNAQGAQTITSVGVTATSAFTPSMVEFDGTNDYAQDLGLTSFGGGKLGLISMDIYFTDPLLGGGNDYVVDFLTSAGSSQISVKFDSRILVELNNTGKGYRHSPSNTVETNTGYTVAVAWDSAIPRWQMWLRPFGGSWTEVTGGSSDLPADVMTDAIGRVRIGIRDGIVGNIYLGDVYVANDRTMDLSDADNRAKLLPTAFKGSNGELVTGTAPPLFLSGPVADWHVNKGTAGGLTLTGALTAAPVTPT